MVLILCSRYDFIFWFIYFTPSLVFYFLFPLCLLTETYHGQGDTRGSHFAKLQLGLLNAAQQAIEDDNDKDDDCTDSDENEDDRSDEYGCWFEVNNFEGIFRHFK